MLTLAAMKKSDAIAVAGSIPKLSELLGIRKQAIYQWGDEVPRLREFEIRERIADFDRRLTKLRARETA